MSHAHKHDHDHKHDHARHEHHHGAARKGLHRDWRAWVALVAVALMIAAMLMYVFSDDESLQPGGGEQLPVPAAP
jgi:hypothetical protein